MRVVVTGAAGFVGRALCGRLARSGHGVVATDIRDAAVIGDLADPAVLNALFVEPVDAVVHLATVPGGGTEADPALAWRVNVDATRRLVDAASGAGCRRVVFASSIAVFGDPLPALVEDATPAAPRLLYGAHKAMMEQWIACQSRRGAIDGLSLRLPGIVARPRGSSGMKSAFISDLFHAARLGEDIMLPVSPAATSWLLSRPAVVEAIVTALSSPGVGDPHRLTLPALRIAMADLVAEVAAQTGRAANFASYAPDPGLEAIFGRQPPLATPRADAIGFRHDGDLGALVATTLADLDREDQA